MLGERRLVLEAESVRVECRLLLTLDREAGDESQRILLLVRLNLLSGAIPKDTSQIIADDALLYLVCLRHCHCQL